MGLRRQRAQRDTRRVEALDQTVQRFHLIQRNRRQVSAQLQQVPQGGHRPLVDQRGIFQIFLVAVALHRLLQGADDIRVVGVVFTTVHILEQTARLQGLAWVPGFGGQPCLISLQIAETSALDTAGHTPEADLHHLVGQAHRLEQLRAPVGRHGGNAHLRENLQQPLGNTLAVTLEHLIQITDHFAGTDQVGQHLVGQPGVDRRGAKTDQHRIVVRIAGGGGFHQNVAITAQPGGGQMVMHRTHGQRGMHRQPARSDGPVTQHQQGPAAAHRSLGLFGNGSQCCGQRQLLIHVQVDPLMGKARLFQL